MVLSFLCVFRDYILELTLLRTRSSRGLSILMRVHTFLLLI